MTGFLRDFFSGNFTAAEGDIAASLQKLPTWIKTLISTVESAEGSIAVSVAETGAKDILANGMSTASFTAAAADMETQLISQEINLGKQTVYSLLNAAVAGAAPVAAPMVTPAIPTV